MPSRPKIIMLPIKFTTTRKTDITDEQTPAGTWTPNAVYQAIKERQRQWRSPGRHLRWRNSSVLGREAHLLKDKIGYPTVRERRPQSSGWSGEHSPHWTPRWSLWKYSQQANLCWYCCEPMALRQCDDDHDNQYDHFESSIYNNTWEETSTAILSCQRRPATTATTATTAATAARVTKTDCANDGEFRGTIEGTMTINGDNGSRRWRKRFSQPHRSPDMPVAWAFGWRIWWTLIEMQPSRAGTTMMMRMMMRRARVYGRRPNSTMAGQLCFNTEQLAYQNYRSVVDEEFKTKFTIKGLQSYCKINISSLRSDWQIIWMASQTLFELFKWFLTQQSVIFISGVYVLCQRAFTFFQFDIMGFRLSTQGGFLWRDFQAALYCANAGAFRQFRTSCFSRKNSAILSVQNPPHQHRYWDSAEIICLHIKLVVGHEVPQRNLDFPGQDGTTNKAVNCNFLCHLARIPLILMATSAQYQSLAKETGSLTLVVHNIEVRLHPTDNPQESNKSSIQPQCSVSRMSLF